ncbi:MAG: hypothetical protein NW216_12985 [Hyphomicrobium sp.]|nr:hypothetical protein [Hyphomicrobium sp.]
MTISKRDGSKRNGAHGHLAWIGRAIPIAVFGVCAIVGPASAQQDGTGDPAGAITLPYANSPATSGTPNPGLGVALPPPTPSAVKIAWRVQNSFRFFKDPKDTDIHRQTYLSLGERERKSPVLAAEDALSQRHADGWSATMWDKVCWNAARNRHECEKKGDYVTPKSHNVVVTLDGEFDTTVACTWRSSSKEGSVATSVKKPCNEELVIEVPYPDGVSLTVDIGGLEVAKSEIKVRDILVAGMGDSFGSGEGNPDVPVRFSADRAADYADASKNPAYAGLPARIGTWKRIGDAAFNEGGARWVDQACHRSLYSHQLRTALQLAIEDPHRAVTFVGLACSGAEVTFGLFLRYKGNEWVPSPPDLSQISALADAQCEGHEARQIDMPEAYHMNGVIPELQGGLVLRKCPVAQARKIDLLLVSAGGNDIGFARLVANAVLSDESVVRQLGGWFGQIHGNMQSRRLMDRLDERYKALNRALHGILHMSWDQSDRIILTAYPPLAVMGDGQQVCPDGTAGMEVSTDFYLSQKRAKAGDELANKLQAIMKKGARTHGWSFVDAHRAAFRGRGICAGYTDNAFSVADDLRLPRKVNGSWTPYLPTAFRAYVPRQRWFRTPNDAFMTGNFHAAGSVTTQALAMQSLARFQVVLAATYSGAFHPTAQGHAAMADAVAAKARQVLQKYGQQSAAALVPRS